LDSGRVSRKSEKYAIGDSLLQNLVAVEKVHFLQNGGGIEMSRKPRKSLVWHPDALLFLRISGKEFLNTHAC
jgi:hypothetical protein